MQYYILLKYIISTVNFEKRKKSLYMQDGFKLICMSVSLVFCSGIYMKSIFWLNFLCTVIFVCCCNCYLVYDFIHSWLSFNCEMKVFHFNNYVHVSAERSFHRMVRAHAVCLKFEIGTENLRFFSPYFLLNVIRDL